MFHDCYNTTHFPFLIAKHGNWHIHCNLQGHCAAIPVVDGCQASHFGDIEYVYSLGLETFDEFFPVAQG